MASSTPVCGICDQSNITIPSMIWCFECDEGLCLECNGHYSLSKGTRKHTTVPMSEYQKLPCDIVKIIQNCVKHNEKFNIYCKKHESLCCGICIVEKHLACRDFGKLADIIQNTKFANAFDEIEQSLAELTNNIQRIRNDRENNMKRLSKKRKQIKQEIEHTRNTLNNHLDKIQADILKKLNATEETETKLIGEQLDLLKEEESELTEYRKHIQNIKQHATDLQKFISIKDLEKKVTRKDEFLMAVIDTEKFEDLEMTYNANAAMQNATNYIKKFGEIIIKTKPCDVILTRRKANQAQIMMPNISPKSVEHIKVMLHKTINTMVNRTWGCCMLPDGRTTFADYFNKIVRIFKTDGSKDFDVTTATNPCDIAYNSEDKTLIVTSGQSDKQCITIIDIQNKQIKNEIPVDNKYYGVAVKDGKFICCAAGKGIHSINPHNNSTNDIVCDKTPKFCYVETFGDKFFQTNNKLNSVICYDIQGSVQWSFKDESVLKGPIGISVDNDGNVYIVGKSSSNVVAISADGQQYKEILTANDDLLDPSCLHYNISSNQLLVANYEKNAMIFTLN